MRDVAAVELDTKVCPRCGERLFADMDVCYGCLYDFRRKPRRQLLPALPQIDAIEGDGARRAGDGLGMTVAGTGAGLVGADAAPPEPEATNAAPDARDEAPSPGAEPMGEASRQSPEATGELVSRSLGVRVRTASVDVCVPLPRDGLVVGRATDCDIVLHAGAVSRRHLSITPTLVGAIATDLGATNPALVRGSRISGSVALGPGDVIDVCGSELCIVDRVRDGLRASADLPTTQLGSAL